MRIAMDSGGTFTDCVFVRDGKLEILKVPSQPKNPAAAIAVALTHARSVLGAKAERKLDLVCGTTVGTNALLERRGGKVLLITTAGFEDMLAIGRQARAKLYDLQFQKAPPLVPRERTIGARERLAADGSFLRKLTKAEIRSLVRKVRRVRPEAVAVCFLFCFRNSQPEALVARALRRRGFLVSVSHEILPEFREFERASTTVINAYLTPVMSRYLRETQAQTSKGSSRAPDSTLSRAVQVHVMQSNGGIISAENAAAQPVRTVLSGPAGGVLGAAYAASLAGLEKLITFDMGGTSTDVALLCGEARITTDANVAGFPLSVPMLEIHTVGAGGGSIARFDAGAALRVGPESAGADPGPICYGRGELPTVTDAHAVLGHFGGRGLLNGGFVLQLERTRRELGKRKGSFRSAETFAQGILGVSNAIIERAVRRISIERGHDPRDYTLVAFGGAGGLHACDLATALEMRGVLLPVFPGGLSALGILRADVVRDFSRTILLPVRKAPEARREAQHVLRKLRRDADDFLRGQGFAKHQRRFEYRFDLRYVGQAYDLSVSARADFLTKFHQAHQRSYGHADPQRPVEIVNVRCRATGISPPIGLPQIRRAARGAHPAVEEKIRCFFDGRAVQASLFERGKLHAGHEFSGPAILVEYSATSLVPAGWLARVDAYGQIRLSRVNKTARRHAR
jgi:N-methylhydantoinase A